MYNGLEVDLKRGDLGKAYVDLEWELFNEWTLDCCQGILIVFCLYK